MTFPPGGPSGPEEPGGPIPSEPEPPQPDPGAPEPALHGVHRTMLTDALSRAVTPMPQDVEAIEALVPLTTATVGTVVTWLQRIPAYLPDE